MSMQYLFGSDSENSEDDQKPSDGIKDEQDELPSTQAHMNELFGESDEDKQNKENSGSSSEDSDDDDDNDNVAQPSALNAQNDQADNSDLDFSGNENEEAGPNVKEEQMEVKNDDNGDGNDDDDDDKVLPTTQDLFGEELDVSSDEEPREEAAKQSNETEPREREERPPTPEKEEEEEEGLSIAIELPRCNISLGKELYFIKLPNFLSVDTKPFDSQFYEDEIDDDEILDEEGRTRLKLKVENTIRWRYSKDKDGNDIKESNCRFVRWSDGSISMHLGNEVFDVFKMPIQGEQNHLFVQQGTGLQAQAVFKNKLSFRPHSTSSQTHRKMTMSIAERMAKAQKIKMMPAMECDPETQRVSMMKKEDERLRAANRRESMQRRMREKRHLKGLSTNYLKDDEDEDLDENLSALKTKYGKDIKSARNKPFSDIYSDEGSDYEEQSKLENAKLDIDSDEDDEEIKRKREELAKKKKSARKVIDESDEESD